jgi:hypothetical protein
MKTTRNVVIELSADELNTLDNAHEIIDGIRQEMYRNRNTVVATEHGNTYDVNDVYNVCCFLTELGFNSKIKLIEDEEQ